MPADYDKYFPLTKSIPFLTQVSTVIISETITDFLDPLLLRARHDYQLFKNQKYKSDQKTDYFGQMVHIGPMIRIWTTMAAMSIVC